MIAAGNNRRRPLAIITAIVVMLWLVVQVGLCVHYWDVAQHGDAGVYDSLARRVVAAGSWYPIGVDLVDTDYIFNPGYVNFLALCLRLTGSLAWVAVVQIVLNCVLLRVIYSIVRRVTGGDAVCADVAVIGFCVIYSNVFYPMAHLTEILFACLLYCGIAMVRPRPMWLFACGVMLVLANWVRPVVILFVPSVLLYFLYMKYPLRCWGGLAAGAAVCAGALSLMSYHSCGRVVLSSTTGGVNLIMSMNDDAKGYYDTEVFGEGKIGYIDDKAGYSVFEKDSMWKSAALAWAKDNPGKVAALAPKKLYYLWSRDVDLKSDLEGDGADVTDAGGYGSYIYRVLYSIPYLLVMLAGVAGVWVKRRGLWGRWGIFLLPLLLGCAMHTLLYGGVRYHYPYMPVVLLFASVGTAYFIRNGWSARASISRSPAESPYAHISND